MTTRPRVSPSCVARSSTRSARSSTMRAAKLPSLSASCWNRSRAPMAYNAATGEYVDFIEAGIVDPTKVARVALQNAASVAALLITTEAMITDRPKKDAAPMGGPGGGGMGGMGDMDF